MTTEREYFGMEAHAAERGIKLLREGSPEAIALRAEWAAANAREAAQYAARLAANAAAAAARNEAISDKIATQNRRHDAKFPTDVTGVVRYKSGEYGFHVDKELRPRGFVAPDGLTSADKGRTVAVRLLDAYHEVLL